MHSRKVYQAVLLTSIMLASQALDFPTFSLEDHPLHTDQQFNSLPKTPAIMKRYMLHTSRPSVHDAYFLPGAASYIDYHSEAPFATKLDVLYTPKSSGEMQKPNEFVRSSLNAPARVILLLCGNHYSKSVVPSRSLAVSGLSKRVWKNPRALRTPDGNTIKISTSRTTDPIELPGTAVAVETELGDGEDLVLPIPAKVSVNGFKASQYILLFAQPDAPDALPRAFPYQKIPKKVKNRQTGQWIDAQPALPNQNCPRWVHDLYVTPTRDRGIASQENELKYWKTWHPSIDPFFWCYFGHEHGSYPGKYKPMFGYTAWKTPDKSTSHGRQDESNEGFKVFSFPLHDQNKFVVFVVHMHLSRARRFSARHHTMILAVFDKDWNLELEFHMKSDFGFAGTPGNRKVKKKLLLFTKEDAKIMAEDRQSRREARRRFNVLNLDDYPNEVDPTVELRGGRKPTQENLDQILKGKYEQWISPLNDCSKTEGGLHRGLHFDCRNPATAKKTVLGGPDEPMQTMSGSSEDRFFLGSKPYKVALEHCGFFTSEDQMQFKKKNGVFFTDPYFSTVQWEPGQFVVRQFIKPDFSGILIPSAKLTPVDTWFPFAYYDDNGKESSSKFRNPEGAVLATEN